MSEWISVKDRLPEKNGKYLAVTEDNEMYHKYVTIRYFYADNPKIFARPSGIIKYTHWMPLPEPPKGDTE